MNIGLYFGSFNPIHNGHIAIAQYMYENYPFDSIWFIVSPSSPFKEKEMLLDDHKRLELVKVAIMGKDYFHASDIEFSMEKPSYTYLTLRKLRLTFLENTYSLILGSDNIDEIRLWKNHEEILDNHSIFVYPRSEKIRETALKNVVYTYSPLLDISSTLIRDKIKNREDIQDLVPKKVLEMIEKERLFK